MKVSYNLCIVRWLNLVAVGFLRSCNKIHLLPSSYHLIGLAAASCGFLTECLDCVWPHRFPGFLPFSLQLLGILHICSKFVTLSAGPRIKSGNTVFSFLVRVLSYCSLKSTENRLFTIFIFTHMKSVFRRKVMVLWKSAWTSAMHNSLQPHSSVIIKTLYLIEKLFGSRKC